MKKSAKKKVESGKQIQTSLPGKNKKWTLVVCGLLIVLTLVISIIAHRIPYSPYTTGSTGATVSYEIAKVSEITEEKLEDSIHAREIRVGQQTLRIKMLSGAHKGETLTAQNYLSTYNSVVAQKDMKLIVIVDSLDTGEFQLRVYNYYRAPVIYLMCAVFFLAMVLVGGRKGMMTGFGLIYSFGCVLLVFLPLVVRGVSPVWSAVLLVALVTSTTMIFINGTSVKSICAVLGTIGGVLLAGILLYIFSAAMHVSGYNTDDAESLMLINQSTGLQVKDLLFAGILVASLGAVMDVAMSVVSAIFEFKAKLPQTTASELFKMGINIGKDMIGTMANTLILAFAGTSLNMMIILQSYSVQYNQLMSMNMIAIEIVQAVCGSMAVVLTVPITAAVASRLFGFIRRPHKAS